MRQFVGEISFLHLLYGYGPVRYIGMAVWGRYSYRVHEKILGGRLRDKYISRSSIGVSAAAHTLLTRVRFPSLVN